MEEKPAELPVSEQEIQIQPPSFLDKLKIHKFKILGGVLGVLVFAGAVFGAYKLGQKQIQLTSQPTPIPMGTPTPTLEVTPTLTPKSTPASQNYPRPNNWKTVTIPKMKISLCLPPKWELGTNHYPEDYLEIFFARDPQYKPRATDIKVEQFLGGSRRNQYVDPRIKSEARSPEEEERLRADTTVEELIINGKSVLDITIPSFPRVLVFTIGNQLFSVGKDYQPLVNDSPSAFQKDIYTIVGCIASL